MLSDVGVSGVATGGSLGAAGPGRHFKGAALGRPKMNF